MKRLVASVRGRVIASDHLDLSHETVETENSEREVWFDGKTIDEVVARSSIA